MRWLPLLFLLTACGSRAAYVDPIRRVTEPCYVLTTGIQVSSEQGVDCPAQADVERAVSFVLDATGAHPQALGEQRILYVGGPIRCAGIMAQGCYDGISRTAMVARGYGEARTLRHEMGHAILQVWGQSDHRHANHDFWDRIKACVAGPSAHMRYLDDGNWNTTGTWR